MGQYFPKPYKPLGGGINIKVDLSNYETKADLKNAARIDKSKLALKSNLASLKAEIDKTAVDKLKTVPVDLNKLKNVVNNDVVRETVYYKLVAKVDKIDISGFALKTKYNTGKSDLERKTRHEDKKFLILLGLLKKQFIMLKLVK